MNKTVALHTLGCKLNFSETSTVGNDFLKNGYHIVEFKDRADVYVLNTCTVTENAERECRQLVRRVLRQNPSAYVIVMGCYAQLRPQEIAQINGVDAVLGSHEKFKLFSLLDSFEKKDLACIYVSPTEQLNDFGFASSTDADSRTRAYFKIQDGCDYKCSFCTIPLARGGSRSMDPESLQNEFNNLITSGYREVILTGVNVGDYGKLYQTNLYSVLKKMTESSGKFRIRISSIEPNLLTDEIIDLAASSEKLCKHFHIPLQSGSPKILKAMQRRYRVSDYEKLVNKLKDRIPEIGIGVDVIAGFPGETEEDFVDTYNFIRDLPVSYMHVFTYSERPDTKAIQIPDVVDVNIRKERNNRLRILSEKKKFEFYSSMLGKETEVLFEHENHNGFMKGFSTNYIRVSNSYNPNYINELTSVKLASLLDGTREGELQGIKKSIDLLAS